MAPVNMVMTVDYNFFRLGTNLMDAFVNGGDNRQQCCWIEDKSGGSWCNYQ